MKLKDCFSLLVILVAGYEATGQLFVVPQLRTRTEFRDGQGTPLREKASPSLFTSQRTRISALYSGYRFKVFTALQDVRVWGQDASTINRTTSEAYNGLMLHEAWAEVMLVDTTSVVKNLALKFGRQELVYDDVRLLGNLDWLQQGRRHDAVLLKFNDGRWIAHAGFAFNQNSERKSGTVYSPVLAAYPAGTNGIGSMYKSMQFAYIARKISFGTVSFLLLKDDFSKYSFAPADSLKSNPIYSDATWKRVTGGINLFGRSQEEITFGLSAFFQRGSYRDGTDLNEYLLSASLMYSATQRLTIGLGVDITSGNDGRDPARKNQRFDPLYGTPHKFWGHMDYFYVADGFGSGGLIDYFIKSKLKASETFSVTGDLHRFVLSDAITSENGEDIGRSLGTELDVLFNYSLTNMVNLEWGLSAMFSTPSMASRYVKNIEGAQKTSTWSYLMVSIKPEIQSAIKK